jgi:hypothetical protein
MSIRRNALNCSPLLWFFLFVAWPSFAQEPTPMTAYQQEIQAIRKRHDELEMERFRTRGHKLDPDKDAERLKLIEQLRRLDPCWIFEEELVAKSNVMVEVSPQKNPNRDKILALYNTIFTQVQELEIAPTQKEAETRVAKLRAELGHRELKANYWWLGEP